MKIDINTKNVANDKRIRRFVEHKLNKALGRISSRINRVRVKLKDNSKGRSEFIGKCQIDVGLAPKGDVFISASGDTIFECIVNAIRKMEHAVKQDIDRHRNSSKIRHQQNKRMEFDSLNDLAVGTG